MDDGVSGPLIYAPFAPHTQQWDQGGPFLPSLMHAVGGAVLGRCQDNYSTPIK